MTGDDGQNGHVLAALESLGTCDVSRRHARRLRRQCHAVLQPASAREVSEAPPTGTALRRIVAPALGGAWCLAYLAEIMRRAAAVYFGAE
jgi:hypothetical protein